MSLLGGVAASTVLSGTVAKGRPWSACSLRSVSFRWFCLASALELGQHRIPNEAIACLLLLAIAVLMLALDPGVLRCWPTHLYGL